MALLTMIEGRNTPRTQRVFAAMLRMVKLDLKKLRAAARGK